MFWKVVIIWSFSSSVKPFHYTCYEALITCYFYYFLSFLLGALPSWIVSVRCKAIFKTDSLDQWHWGSGSACSVTDQQVLVSLFLRSQTKKNTCKHGMSWFMFYTSNLLVSYVSFCQCIFIDYVYSWFLFKNIL